MIYLDTSTLVAYYTTEEHSLAAQAILLDAELPVISDLVIAEFNVAIHRKRARGYLSPEAVGAVFALFDEHVRETFLQVPLAPAQIAATRDLAEKLSAATPLRTLDALHLAIAIEVGGALATFDQRLAEAARAMRIEVLPTA